jgi:hypothetical protein
VALEGLTDQELALLGTALGRHVAAQDGYRLYRDYYDGDHRLAFATDKYRTAFGSLFAAFADNLCPAVVDAVADKLQVTDWGVADAEGGDDDAIHELAEAIWVRNQMARRAGEVHTEALRQGDAYVLVWADAEGLARLYPQQANTCTVAYDPEEPGTVALGVKAWRVPAVNGQASWRVNVYLPDRLAKYRTKATADGGTLELKVDRLEPHVVQGEAWPLPHALGRVPLVPFGNNANVGQFGRSELRDVVPLQDALNKSVADMMVAMEYVALPQRWATGIEVPLDTNGEPAKEWTPDVSRLWSTPATDARFGEFGQADLASFLKVQDGFRAEVARVSATPFHYLMLITGDFPSGEAMKTAEQRFVAKVRDRMNGYGASWSTVMALALAIEGTQAQVEPDWPDPAPKSELDHLNSLKVKSELGVPQPVLWKEMGYTQDEVDAMDEQAGERRVTLADSMAAALNAGM